MVPFVSKLSTPIAAAVLLVAASLASSANAAQGNGTGERFQSQPTGAFVEVDYRGHRDHRNDGWGRHGSSLDPHQIRRSLRHRGFNQIDILDRRGPVYIVEARGWRGYPVRLVVDSRTADIIRSQPAGHGNWRRGW